MNNLTLHILNTVPWSNLNRDDTGTPKRAVIGGVLRGMLSSQSIKRAARSDYETRSLDKSIRSTNLSGIITDRAREINPDLDPKTSAAAAKKLVSALVKNAGGEEKAGKESGTSSWLSLEEVETAAAAVAAGATTITKDGKEEAATFVDSGKTGSLSIAAFGRMFAAAPEANTAAAIAVSPAMSVHKAVIETDYFSTMDEDPKASHKGASYLGVASYTSGVFYRTVTIDREQLKRSWTGMSADTAQDQLALMAEALIYKLPSGKRNATAPYVAPLVVLAEEQSYRLAYDFETPVLPGNDGGYGDPAVRRLAEQRAAALDFDKGNFGIALAAGTATGLDVFNAETTGVDGVVAAVVEWILA
ncbi:type I-E CRISPR-associated protein Cas7/Cse4/CasC [Arthrobacter sp. ISL-28]|uniref:type I-E CRISPR-associated protein Cas7/Cse4/CasC n=1 Tax=Arthrobacter sp. ISL-28 TaxID=2819108 RepID=UPI001BE9B900|nr:type I-E CRISPR-associated protein Cas7/Cse4/CasC [Arthrobacter sp. ISL-28]MBT2520861.1 type I-E CRISPR-associated protein Cas7/Cse4/CasC [Arthrobacter sp. ISL-28]